MIINRTHRFIYLKTRKTASTSIEKYLSLYNSDQDNMLTDQVLNSVIPIHQPTHLTRYHAAAIDIVNVIGINEWNTYTKITSVRNPYEKLISGFFFLYEFLNLPILEKDKLIDEFRHWIANYKNNNLIKQIIDNRIIYSLDNKICTENIIRVEHLIDDLEIVCRNINLPFYPNKIEKLNSSARPSWATCEVMYNTKTKELVGKLFQFELDYFNYNFPN